MILVTGATGYVGRRVVRKLVEEGEMVRCLVRPSSELAIFEGLDVETHIGDVTDPPSLTSACQHSDAVVHLVAIIRERGDYTLDRVNHLGTRNVVEAAREAEVKRLVHLSAVRARSEPRYPFLYSKWQGEQAIVKSGVSHVILRSSIIFGRGDEFINALAASMRWGPVAPIIGRGKTRFQPILAEDVATCIIEALKDQGLTGSIVEIGGPDQLSYQEMVDMILHTSGLRRLKVHIPLFVMRTLAPVLAKLVPHPPITQTQLDMVNLDNIAQLDSVEKHFHFRPRPLEGNIDYISDMGRWEAMAISLGLRPARRW